MDRYYLLHKSQALRPSQNPLLVHQDKMKACVKYQEIHKLRVLSHELLMKLPQATQHILLGQNCSSEMVSSWLLTKTRARNDANTSGLKKVKCVEDISRLTGLGCSRQGLLRELDL